MDRLVDIVLHPDKASSIIGTTHRSCVLELGAALGIIDRTDCQWEFYFVRVFMDRVKLPPPPDIQAIRRPVEVGAAWTAPCVQSTLEHMRFYTRNASMRSMVWTYALYLHTGDPSRLQTSVRPYAIKESLARIFRDKCVLTFQALSEICGTGTVLAWCECLQAALHARHGLWAWGMSCNLSRIDLFDSVKQPLKRTAMFVRAWCAREARQARYDAYRRLMERRAAAIIDLQREGPEVCRLFCLGNKFLSPPERLCTWVGIMTRADVHVGGGRSMENLVNEYERFLVSRQDHLNLREEVCTAHYTDEDLISEMDFELISSMASL